MNNKITLGIGALAVIAFCVWVYGNGGVLPNGARVAPNSLGGRTVTTDQGTVQSGVGSSYPSNWPDNAPQYPSASITTSFESSAQAPMESSMVQFTTRDSGESVVNFYKSALTQNGWQAVNALQAGGTKIVQGTHVSSKRVFSVSITESSGVTTVIVSVSTSPVVTPI